MDIRYVLMKIEEYEELLERLEDAEALQMLKKVREKPLEYIKFEDCGLKKRLSDYGR